jgi:pilus assembly protein CpaB
MGRRTLLLITSILIAAVGTALIGLYVKGANDRAIGQQTLKTIVVARTDIDAGKTATLADLAVARWPVGNLPASYFTSPDQVVGKTAKSTVWGQSAIQPQMFAPLGAQTGNGIQKGQLGITVQLSDPQRAAGLLKVGSRITIFTIPDASKKSRPVLEQPATVIRIGNDGESSVADPQSDQTSLTGQSGQSGLAGPGASGASADDVPRTIVGLTLTETAVKRVMDAQTAGTLFFAVLPESPGS